ncbi:MAG: hypothetical protein GX946_00970 [Oligosphaeraceae bacterium]|nr:hypothetical protein [Oligosphaeraceae bacterium]
MAEREGWLKVAWQFLVWCAGKAMEFIHFCLDKLLAEKVTFDFGVAASIILITTLLIGSGCWAASIAISRRHSGLLHFVLGLVFPIIHPFTIMFGMDLHGERARRKKLAAEQRKREQAEVEKQRMLEIQGAHKTEEQGEESTEDTEKKKRFDKAYFERIARDKSGENAGPWQVGFGDDDIIVQQILEVQDNLLLVEVTGREGKNEKLRIPYNRIDYWTNYY